MASSPPQEIEQAAGLEQDHADMRDAPRFTLMLRQARLSGQAGQFLCVVRDISQTGIRVKVFHPLPTDPRMEIEVSERRSVRMERVWLRGDEAGFRFENPLDLEAFLADDPKFPRRQFRVDIEMPVTVTLAGVEYQASTVNISQQGACIECPVQLPRQSLVTLRSEKLPALQAKVMWRHGSQHGLIFEDTYSLRDFAAALGRLQGFS